MRVIKFIFKNITSFKKYIWGLLITVLLISSITSIDPYLIKLLIDNVRHTDSNYVLYIIGSYGALQIIYVLSWKLSDLCSMQMTTNFRVSLLTNLIQEINNYSYKFFQNNLSGSVQLKINDIFTITPSIIFTFIMEFVHFTFLLVMTIYCLGKVHILFTFSLLCWVIFFLFFSYFQLKKSINFAKESTKARATISGYLADYITNILNVKLFSKFNFEQEKLKLFTNDFVIKSQKQSLFLSNYYLTQGIVSSIYGTGFIIGLVYLHRQNIITAGDFALVFMLNFNICRNLYGLSHQLRDFISNVATIDQHLSFFETSKNIYSNHLIGTNSLAIKKGEIKFENVKFYYQETYSLFNNLSVSVKASEKVGLVGFSGSGKTSFVNLLLGLYEVQEGKIYIDGYDIKDINQDSLYKAISMIPQDPSLFHQTIKENIAYGKPEATDEEIITAAEKAHAYFISTLPEGYNSLVGERGIKLSGGQRQRIAIARAILKNAPILILDEATSQLDSVTENYIQASLWDIIKNKTTIIIAHRLSTILHMDRLLVFDQGKIVEDGTHEELLAKNGFYKSLWDAQKNGFLPTESS